MKIDNQQHLSVAGMPRWWAALARGIGLLPRRAQPAVRARYDLSDPKAAEHAIVRDALAGAVQYRRWAVPTGMLLVRHGVAADAAVVVRVGHGGSVSTRAFVQVNGVDMSEESRLRFDAHRVAAAVLDGRDPRVASRSKALA